MPDVGEEIVGAYLKMCKGCDFVDYDVHLRDEQGDVDVIGIDLKARVAYVCEVATHIRGLQYNRVGPDGKRVVDNFERLLSKFKKDAHYAQMYLSDFTHIFEFWSPVVRDAPSSAKSNPVADLKRLVEKSQAEQDVHVGLVINRLYAERFDELRDKARQTTRDVHIGVFRLLQVAAACERYSAPDGPSPRKVPHGNRQTSVGRVNWSLQDGQRLRDTRDGFGLSQQVVARGVGCTPSRISELERARSSGNRPTAPSPALRERIVEFFEAQKTGTW